MNRIQKIALTALFLLMPLLTYQIGLSSGIDTGYVDGYSMGFQQGLPAKQGLAIFTSTGTAHPINGGNIVTAIPDDITLKYLDDPGLVVKWEAGEIFSDNETMPLQWIQRFEPWLNQQTGRDFKVTWEK